VDREGLISLVALRNAIRKETVLITVMHANNELGTVQPLEEIGRIAAEADIYFHTDAVQSAGKLPIDVNALELDLLALSGHKFYGPKGIGALYIRGGTRLQQLLYGGHHQRGFRPGTENVAGIVGLGKAAEIARKSLAEDAARISAFRDQLEQGLLSRIPHARANGAGAPRTPNTANIAFPGLEGEALVIALDLKGLACSTGAACSSSARGTISIRNPSSSRSMMTVRVFPNPKSNARLSHSIVATRHVDSTIMTVLDLVFRSRAQFPNPTAEVLSLSTPNRKGCWSG